MESKPIRMSSGIVWQLPDGTIHRLDGPAVIWDDGRTDWFINGNFVTKKITQWAKEMNIDLNNLSDQDKQMIVLYWS